MSSTYPDWVVTAMPYVKAWCAPDDEPTLTDDEIAECIVANVFRPVAYGADPDDPPRVDIFGAVHMAWMKKAGKVAGDYAFSEGGLSDHPEQVYAHCIAMADKYNPVGIL